MQVNTEYLKKIPKAEIHIHLDGALTPALTHELAKEQNYFPLSEKSLKEIRDLITVTSPKPALYDVLKVFNEVYPLLKNRKALEKVAHYLCARAKEQNILYFETRFAPALFVATGLTMADAMDAILRGLSQGKKDFGVDSGMIICFLREMNHKNNEKMFDIAQSYFNKGVVAVDLAGNEAADPLSGFVDYFKEAKRIGLGLTVHAAEVPQSHDAELALKLGVHRISHAAFLSGKTDMLQEIVSKKIAIEINLTSNLRTGAVPSYEKHPIREFFDMGIQTVLSTDDPGIFDIDLIYEYDMLAKHLGFTKEEIAKVALYGAQSLFLPDDKKSDLVERFKKELSSL
ncbi:adenosine deaminase [Elusimicrobiota bacterium]